MTIHPDFANVADGIWKNEQTGFFYFVAQDDSFSQPYPTVEQARTAMIEADKEWARKQSHPSQ